MSWTIGSSASQSERIRPSEINGCTVQQISFLEEIDDENVLEALERLRGRSLSVPVGAFVTTKGRPPRVPKQQKSVPALTSTPSKGISINSSSNSSTVSHLTTATPKGDEETSSQVKGSHRSFDSKKKRETVPDAAFLTPDSSVASSLSGGRETNKNKPSSISRSLTWAWLGKSFSDMHCGGFRAKNDEEASFQFSGRSKQLIPLGVLNRHLVNGCVDGGEYDEDDDETLNSETVITYDEESTFERDDDRLGRRNSNLKSKVAQIFDATVKLLAEGGFGENDSVTLYAYNEMDYIHGDDDRSSEETYLTLESTTYDGDETISWEQAPDDEVHQDLTSGKTHFVREGNRSFTNLGTVGYTAKRTPKVKTRNDNNEEGQEIDQDGVPHQLLVVGYEPPDDCSLLSESSQVYMQAISKKGTVIN